MIINHPCIMGVDKRFTAEQSFQKIKHYCSYQERCHKEVKEKLYSLGLRKSEVEEIIVKLIEENYLNEERFAIQFTHGKFSLKHWGKEKIRYELKQKNISAYCIDKALAAIAEPAYLKSFEKLFKTKLQSLKHETNAFIRKRKLQDFLLQKGYERDLIVNYIKDV